jgi:hypothetical protein
MARNILPVVFLLAGCSADPTCPAEFSQPARPDLALTVPDAGLAPAAKCAAARWTRATGVQLGVGGTAPHVVTVRRGVTETVSGDYDPTDQTLRMSATLPDEWTEQVLTHELGHALQSRELSHTGLPGIMNGSRLSHDDDYIGAADLELICGGEAPLVPCVWFRPER